jgi:hypothetical protein
MRLAVFSLVIAALITIALHFIPDWSDDFYGAEFHGAMVKVFPRGFPINYVFEGDLKNSTLLIIARISANLIICWATLYLFMFAVFRLSRWRWRHGCAGRQP